MVSCIQTTWRNSLGHVCDKQRRPVTSIDRCSVQFMCRFAVAEKQNECNLQHLHNSSHTADRYCTYYKNKKKKNYHRHKLTIFCRFIVINHFSSRHSLALSLLSLNDFVPPLFVVTVWGWGVVSNGIVLSISLSHSHLHTGTHMQSMVTSEDTFFLHNESSLRYEF
jgi:hypothetical protein